jgi:hypothetical protein
LSERLEEYKRCIWEVEKVAESLQQATPYSSHGKYQEKERKEMRCIHSYYY